MVQATEFINSAGGVLPAGFRAERRIGHAQESAEFEASLPSWGTALHEITGGEVVAINGKTLRRSVDVASGKSAIHMVS